MATVNIQGDACVNAVIALFFGVSFYTLAVEVKT
jgi:hypothetical protein